MTSPKPTPADDRLPPARMVRWLLLAGLILFSAGLYFRFGLNVQPLGTVRTAPATPAP